MTGGINTSVALGVQPGLLQPQGAAANPLEIARTAVEIQKGYNDITTQNNVIAARNGLADLMAVTPPDQLQSVLRSSPYSAWVPEIMEGVARTDQAVAAAKNLQANTSKTYQEIGDNAVSAVGKMLPELMIAPYDQQQNIIQSYRESALNGVPQDQRASVGNRIDSMIKGVYAGTTSDQYPNGGDPALLGHNIGALSTRFGFTPESLSNASGGGIITINDRTYRRNFGDSSLIPMVPMGGPGTPTTLVPAPGGYVSPGSAGLPPGTPVPATGVAPPGSAGATPTPAQPATAAAPPAVGPTGGATTGGATPTTTPSAAAPAAQVSGPGITAPVQSQDGTQYAMSDGRPLVTGSLSGKSPVQPLPPNPVTGRSEYPTSSQESQVTQRSNTFQTQDTEKYNSATTVLGQTQLIRDAYNQLRQAGGIMTPGTGLPFRADILRTINTVRGVVGQNDEQRAPIMANAEAAFTDLMKQQITLGFGSTAQFFGHGREAATTIQTALHAVPGGDNTFLSGQLVNRTIEALAQRQSDMHLFAQQYARENHGSYIGYESAFNAQHPIKALTDKVLSEFGMGEHGFVGASGTETAANIGTAYQRGYLSYQQAQDLLAHKSAKPVQKGDYFAPTQ